MMAELGLRDPQKILARVDWQGESDHRRDAAQ